MVAFGLRVLKKGKKAALMVAFYVSLIQILTRPDYKTVRLCSSSSSQPERDRLATPNLFVSPILNSFGSFHSPIDFPSFVLISRPPRAHVQRKLLIHFRLYTYLPCIYYYPHTFRLSKRGWSSAKQKRGQSWRGPKLHRSTHHSSSPLGPQGPRR